MQVILASHFHCFCYIFRSSVESEVMMGLEQLLQIVHKQQKEMAELRGQAEQQKLLIAEIHKLHLDNGGQCLPC